MEPDKTPANKNKILVVTSTFPRWPHDSGSPFVYHLCQQLVKYHNFEVVVLSPYAQGAKHQEWMEGIFIQRFRYLPTCFGSLAYDGGIISKLNKNKWYYFHIPFFFIFQIRMIRQIVKEKNIKVIHAHWLIPQGFLAVLFKKLFKPDIKILCTSHGSDLTTLKNPLLNRIKKFTLKNTDKLTAVSHDLKDKATELWPSSHITVVPMGIDIKIFRKKEEYKNVIRKQFNIKGPLFLSVGRLSLEKNVESIIKAMPYVLKDFSSARLLIIGSGPCEQRLKQLIQNLDLENQVTMLGHIQNQELPKYYSDADFLINPSFREGMPVTLIEAISCGCCVVCSHLPTLTEVIKEGETGFFLESTDEQGIARKVLELLKNPCLMSKIKEKGAQIIQDRFDWLKISRAYAQILNELNSCPN